MSNISYLPKNAKLRTFLQPGSVTFILEGLRCSSTLHKYTYKRYNPVITIEPETTYGDAEQRKHVVTVKNLDLDSLNDAPWLSLSFESLESANEAATALYEGLWSAHCLPQPPAHASAPVKAAPGPGGARFDRTHLAWAICAGALLGSIGTMGANSIFRLNDEVRYEQTISAAHLNLSKQQINREDLALISPAQVSKSEARNETAPLPRTQSEINENYRQMEPVSPASAQLLRHTPVQELRLNEQALKNLQAAGSIAGLHMFPERVVSSAFWLFIDPDSSHSQTLLQRIDLIQERLLENGLAPVVLPVAGQSTESAKKVVASMCENGKTEQIRTIPGAWYSGLFGPKQVDICEGGINRLKLATALFEYFGLQETPTIVSSSGAITAFANASADEIIQWLKVNR